MHTAHLRVLLGTLTPSGGTIFTAYGMTADQIRIPVQAAKIDGPFEVGAKITTKVKGNRPLTSTVTRMEVPHLWIGVAKAPGVTMTIDHIIEPIDTGVVLTERLTFSGPLAWLVSRLMGRRIETTFGATTAHGAEVAEAQPA